MINQIRNLVAQARIEEALEKLNQATTGDAFLHNQVVILQAQFQKLRRDGNLGMLSHRDATIENAKITNAILEILPQISAAAQQPHQPKAIEPPKLSEEKPTPAPQNSSEPKPHPNAWLIGLGMLAVIITLLMFVPCPTETQFFAFQLALALAAAVLGSQLPGMFSFEMPPMIKSGGALAIFAAVYFTNPAKLVGDDRCKSGAFEFTVQLKASPTVPATYPKLENASLELWLENYWKPNDAFNEGVADFKTLPAEKRDQKVAARLKARYWKLSQDSIQLIGKSQVAQIEPDGSLSKIEGKIMDNKTGAPIAGATAEAQGLTAISDAQGNFSIPVPLEKQRVEYEVYINKTGFATWKGGATPATGAVLKVLLSKKK